MFLRSQVQSLPLLYVNQFVSSSLRWTELRLVARQQAGEWGGGPSSLPWQGNLRWSVVSDVWCVAGWAACQLSAASLSHVRHSAETCATGC